MIDIYQRVPIKWGNQNKKHYIQLGYNDMKSGTVFYPELWEVSLQSHVKIEAICDYCGNTYNPMYYTYMKHHKNSKDCCNNCKRIKEKEFHKSTLQKRASDNFNKLRRIIDEQGYTLITKESDYTGIFMDIKYICPKHGVTSQTLNNIINNHNYCNQCGNEKISKSKQKPGKEVKKYIDGINNNCFLNPNDYKNNRKRNLMIRCNCGRIYITSLLSFINGKNQCGVCCGSESRGEQKIRQWLELNGITYQSEYIFNDCKDKKPLPFDFYLSDYNLCIEYDGQQHYDDYFYKTRKITNYRQAFEKCKIHDKIKTDYCKKNKIELLRIPYTEYRHIDSILNDKLKIT